MRTFAATGITHPERRRRGRRFGVCLGLSLLYALIDGVPSHAAMRASDYFESQLQIEFADAAASGRADRLEALRAKGADINARGRRGMTPALWAVLHLSRPGLSYLLQHNADPNLQTQDGYSAVSMAARLRDSSYLTEILSHGGDVNLVNPLRGNTPIFDALDAGQDRAQNVRLLIARGADLNVLDHLGQTPPMAACAIQRTELLYEMLVAGADPTVKNTHGVTLLSYVRKSLVPKTEPWMAKVRELLQSKGLDLEKGR